MFDRGSNKKHVNDSRMELFAQKERAIDSIPPTKAALVDHTKRDIFQGGCVWGKELLCLRSFLAQKIEDGQERLVTNGNQFGVLSLKHRRFVKS